MKKDTMLYSGEFFINSPKLLSSLPSSRTFGQPRCTFNMMCYLNPDELGRAQPEESWITSFFRYGFIHTSQLTAQQQFLLAKQLSKDYQWSCDLSLRFEK